jgi:hypothetical protein
VSEEQRICNEALTSHEFDGITDEEWVALCEQAAQGARRGGQEDLLEGGAAE